MVSFTSWQSSPTGFQKALLYPDKTLPILFTIPHSGFVPGGAEYYGFGYDSEKVLTFRGEKKFVGCQSNQYQKDIDSYQIWWQGARPVAGISCTRPLAPRRDQDCSTVD